MWKPARIFCLIFAALCLPEEAVSADVFAGGGPRRTDCLTVFDVPAASQIVASRLVCVDGDPGCDADGEVNGRCVFEVGLCANYTGNPGCDRSGVRWITVADAEDDGSREFDPDFQALQLQADAFFDFPEEASDRCMPRSTVIVPVDGPRRGGSCRTGRKTVRLQSRSTFQAGSSVVDRDRLRLSCRPAPAGCDEKLFFSSSFDRIQRQVFNQGCAVGGCHDSESTAGGLLLEIGASYPGLVDTEPLNGAARAAGLLLVDAGDPENSFLLRKLEGTLAPGFGGRMPADGPRIPGHLRELVREWIVSGSPENGWLDDPAGQGIP